MSATNRGTKRKENDFYATPIPVIETLFKHYKIPDGNILEPSAGNGNFITAIRRERESNCHITALELRSEEREKLDLISDEVIVTDFLKWETDKKFDLIIGNPPYTYAREFMEKCFELSHKNTEVVMLLRTAFLESKGRYDFWQQHPVNKLYVLSSRPSFTGKGTDATSYSWFIWNGSGEQEIKVI